MRIQVHYRTVHSLVFNRVSQQTQALLAGANMCHKYSVARSSRGLENPRGRQIAWNDADISWVFRWTELPHLEYCSPLLLGVGKVLAHKIESANYYTLRTLTGHGKSLSYQELLNICELDTLECRRKQQSLILLFKCIRNLGPKYIRDFFSIRETSYNLRGNGVNLCIPKFNLNFMRNSFTYKCAQLWNKLPEDVKLADNVDIFKAKLKLIQL